MGLMDILNGMQNGPRGQRTPAPPQGRTGVGGSGLSPIMTALLGLLAYKAIQSGGLEKMLRGGGATTGASPPTQPGSGGGGLGDILGGILGGGGKTTPAQGGTGGAGGGGLADILGGILGGGGQQPRTNMAPGAGGGSLTDLLGGLFGGGGGGAAGARGLGQMFRATGSVATPACRQANC
jgi:hypothetical protein